MLLLCSLAGLYDYMIHGTVMYYKVHRLPIPSKYNLARNYGSPASHRISADDQGNLIQNDALADDLEGDEEHPPRLHQPGRWIELSQ